MQAIDTIMYVFAGGLVSVVTLTISHRRDLKRDRMERRVQAVISTERLYEEALFVIERNARLANRGTHEVLESTARMLSRMQLIAPPEVYAQYNSTAEALDAWADEANKGAPKRSGGYIVLSTTDTPHVEKAKVLFPVYQDEYEKLLNVMRASLTNMKASLDTTK